MVEAFRCSQCSAAVTDDRWTNCPYCGAVLAKPTINPLRAVTAPERFAAVERASEYEELLRHEPSSTGKLIGFGFQTALLVVFVLVSGAVTVGMLDSGPVALVPGLVCGFGAWMLVRNWKQTASFAGAELRRTVAVWRDERTEVSGGGKNSSASTDHYVLLEDREGQRIEFPCGPRLAGAHAPGDIGVAYLRGGVLLDFRRVDA